MTPGNSFTARLLWILSASLTGAAAIANPLLHVSPASRLWMDDTRVVVTGATPGGKVVIEASLVDLDGTPWSARGIFYADAEGVVDDAVTNSIGGTYTGVHPNALTWSMLPVTAEELDRCTSAGCMRPDRPSTVSLSTVTPTTIAYSATVPTGPGGLSSVTLSATQSAGYLAPGVKRIEVTDGDLRGVLFEPPGDGPFPAVVYVSGSGGGAHERAPALLAARGLAALAIGHFNYRDRPPLLTRIPLEYFRDAIDWLRDRYSLERVALSGFSRGGEAVLLIAATYPERVSAVVAGVPSNLVWGGCCGDEAEGIPAWTIGGQDVDYAPFDEERGEREGSGPDAPISYRRVFIQSTVEGEHTNSKYAIPIERIDGPILFLSADADEIWPGTLASDVMLKRLGHAGFGYPVHHEAYPGAGHMIFSPTPVSALIDRITHGLANEVLVTGGTPEGNAAGIRGYFARQAEFLAHYAQGH